MKIELSPRVIDSLHEALTEEKWRASPFPERAARRVRNAVSKGFVLTYDVDDILMNLGMPCNLRNFINDFGLMEPLFFRPRSKWAAAFPSDRVPLGVVASAAIMLERLGLDVDAAPVVEITQPLICKDELTQSELDLFWFEERRHKFEPITLTLPGVVKPVATVEPIALKTGYKLSVGRDADGRVVSLQVVAPRYQPREDDAPVVQAVRPEPKIDPAEVADLGEVEEALDALLRGAIEYDGVFTATAQGKSPLICYGDEPILTGTDAEIAALAERPMAASCRQSLRRLGSHVLQLTGGVGAMVDVAHRVAKLDPRQASRRLSVLDHAWDGIGDERGRWAA